MDVVLQFTYTSNEHIQCFSSEQEQQLVSNYSLLFTIHMLAEAHARGKFKSKPPKVKWRLHIAWYQPGLGR